MIRCPACGARSPDWAEFCHRCGRYFTEADRAQAIGCPECGTERMDGSTYCHNCGHEFNSSPVDPTTAKMLAVLPGFLYIYGLGHIYLRSYAKGGSLLALSLVNILLILLLGGDEIIRWGILFFDLAIFIWQTSDVYRIVRARGS